jgi:hypothetical protein
VKTAQRANAERLKKQRLIKQKRRAARLAAAKRRAAEAWQRAALERPAAARQVAAAWQAGSGGGGGFVATDSPNVRVLALTALGAFLILGLGLVPSTGVPRSRISAALEEHRGHFTLVGGMVLLSVAVFSTLTLLTK